MANWTSKITFDVDEAFNHLVSTGNAITPRAGRRSASYEKDVNLKRHGSIIGKVSVRLLDSARRQDEVRVLFEKYVSESGFEQAEDWRSKFYSMYKRYCGTVWFYRVILKSLKNGGRVNG